MNIKKYIKSIKVNVYVCYYYFTAVEDIRIDSITKSKVAREANQAINDKCDRVSGRDSRLHLSVSVLGAKLVEHRKDVLMARVREHERREDVEELCGDPERADPLGVLVPAPQGERDDHNDDDDGRAERPDAGDLLAVELLHPAHRGEEDHEDELPELRRAGELGGQGVEEEPDTLEKVADDDEIADHNANELDADGKVDDEQGFGIKLLK